ncbi:MAG: hypothetical protein RL660_1418 [Bacteroidota bacterium]|jgi:hypothetical protein
MFQYNVTIKIEKEIREAWLAWMQSEHLQQVLDTKCFDAASLHELLEPIDDDGFTFVATYTTSSKARYNEYIELYAPLLREKGFQLFGNKFIAFRSLIQKLHEL